MSSSKILKQRGSNSPTSIPSEPLGTNKVNTGQIALYCLYLIVALLGVVGILYLFNSNISTGSKILDGIISVGVILSLLILIMWGWVKITKKRLENYKTKNLENPLGDFILSGGVLTILTFVGIVLSAIIAIIVSYKYDGNIKNDTQWKQFGRRTGELAIGVLLYLVFVSFPILIVDYNNWGV